MKNLFLNLNTYAILLYVNNLNNSSTRCTISKKTKQEERTMSDGIAVARRENNVITRKEESSSSKKLFSEFNKVFISGRIEKKFEKSHKVMRETFYKTRVRVERPSGKKDLVPIMVSELLLKKEEKKQSIKGKWVEVAGQFRSYDKIGEDGCKHLENFLFVTEINFYEYEDELDEVANSNLIYLEGYLCKPPVYRETSLGSEITDFMLAVNRKYRKSDYIPCIIRGRVARWVSEFEVGSCVKLYGRVQSREYFKRYSKDSDAGGFKTTYEISVMEIQKV